MSEALEKWVQQEATNARREVCEEIVGELEELLVSIEQRKPKYVSDETIYLDGQEDVLFDAIAIVKKAGEG